MEKVKYIKIGQAPKRRRVSLQKWLAQMDGWTIAWYAFLTLAGIALFKEGSANSLRERGYFAVGSEALALLLPVLYYITAKIIRDIVRDVKSRRNKW